MQKKSASINKHVVWPHIYHTHAHDAMRPTWLFYYSMDFLSLTASMVRNLCSNLIWKSFFKQNNTSGFSNQKCLHININFIITVTETLNNMKVNVTIAVFWLPMLFHADNGAFSLRHRLEVFKTLSNSQYTDYFVRLIAFSVLLNVCCTAFRPHLKTRWSHDIFIWIWNHFSYWKWWQHVHIKSQLLISVGGGHVY